MEVRHGRATVTGASAPGVRNSAIANTAARDAGSRGGPSLNPAAPTPIPLRDVGPALLAAAFALLVLAVVSLDTSAVSEAGLVLHELMHDGRHVLGVPCH